MTNAEKYIQLYKELEEVVRSTYNLEISDSISRYLSQKNEFSQYRNEIQYCQEVRNLLQHKKKICDSFAIQPSDAMIRFIEDLIGRIRGRPKCSDIMIPFSKVYWQAPDDTVRDAMLVMREKVYTHIPILREQRIAGVFSEVSVFNYLVDEEIVEIHERLIFSDLEKYLDIDSRSFEGFRFENRNLFVDELKRIFEYEFDRGNRLAMVFITENGKETEKVLGIITPWDILGNRKEY